MLVWIEWSLRHPLRGERLGERPEDAGRDHVEAPVGVGDALHRGRFPHQCWIVKKELLWLPFVGWGLMAIRCDRHRPLERHAARDQIVEQGAKRIAAGPLGHDLPRGHARAVGKRGRYGIGGAMLATRTGTPILPIAHNAGEYWGRYAFRKHAGDGAGGDRPADRRRRAATCSRCNREVEEWIEGQMRVI